MKYHHVRCFFPRFICVLSAAAVFLFLRPSVSGEDVPLHGESVVRFASLKEAQSILGTRDRFVEALSPFDRQSRLETERDVSEKEFLLFVQSQAREWTSHEIGKLSNVVNRIRQKLAPFKLPFPESVLLIQTTGREEGDAAYCRASAVILPHNKISESDEQLERLLTHELFHIVSSHNRPWRYELYKIVRFQSCPPVELPDSLKRRKLTNPDAPLIDVYISLDVDGENVFAAPVLYANSDKFDVKRGGPFFRYLVFRLMVIEQVAGKWHAVVDAGEPRMLEPSKIPDYKRQIGSNTQYIIHPDEILADNFVHVVHQTPSLPSPQIADALRRAITQ